MEYCILEELVTLQYGSFMALSEQAKQLTQNRMLKVGYWQSPEMPTLPGWTR